MINFSPISDERHGVPKARATPSRGVLVLMGVVFALYVTFGKGFAYAGVPPVYVGEVVLAIVLVSVVGPSMPLPRSLPVALTVGMVGMVLVQVVVDRMIGVDPWIETLRGVAPVYYSAFAFAVYALLRAYEGGTSRQVVTRVVDEAASRGAPLVTVAVAGLAALLLTDSSWLPAWPNSGQTMLASKSGDLAVALVLVVSFLASARGTTRVGPVRVWLFALWGVAALFITFRSRGALLALIAGLLVIRPRAERLIKVLLAGTTVALVLYLSGISFEVRGREVSYAGLHAAIASTLGAASEEDIGGSYVGTADWRTEWWADIWEETVGEPMLVHGHGWGDNLYFRYVATAQTFDDDDRVLRLPHNVFFSIAGRAGLVVAVVLLLIPILTIVRTFRGRDPTRTTRAVHAARGALAAAVVTGLFDIYLEAPQGGIVCWTLIGFMWWATAPPLDPGGSNGHEQAAAAAGA